MTDEEMKKRLMMINGEEITRHGAAIAAFCTAYDVPLEKGVEIAMDLLGDILKKLISSGALDVAERYCNRSRVRSQNLIRS